MASFIEYLDIFRTSFTFSNRISSTFSKIFTISYVALFFYFTLSALLSIYVGNTINVTNVTTFDKQFSTTDDFYKQMHVILYIQLYANDGTALDEEATERIINSNLDIKISQINSHMSHYQTAHLNTYQCLSKHSILTYCLSYDINSISDFLSITFNKPLLVTTEEFNTFLDNYSIRFHIDYYFTKSTCTSDFNFFKVEDIFAYLLQNNQNYDDNGIFDYVKNTYGFFTLNLNKKAINTSYEFSYNVLQLNLDSSVLMKQNYSFFAFQYNNRAIKTSRNLLSFRFQLLPLVETYYFSYKKIQTGLAEVAGLLNVIKFIGVTLIIVINFFKQHTSVTNQFYNKNIIFGRDPGKWAYEVPPMSSNVKNTILDTSNPSGTVKKLNDYRKLSGLQLVQKQIEFKNERVYTFDSNLKLSKVEPKARVVVTNVPQYKKYLDEFKIDKFRFSSLATLRLLCLGKCIRSKRSSFKIYISMIFENLRKMDFMYMIDKVNQIDVITHLLLDDSQKALLKYIQKEQVYFDNSGNRTYFVSKHDKVLDDSQKIQAMSDFFNRVKGNRCSDVDRKLLSLLDEELITCSKI
jgi:hypothetical protein